MFAINHGLGKESNVSCVGHDHYVFFWCEVGAGGKWENAFLFQTLATFSPKFGCLVKLKASHSPSFLTNNMNCQ
jgi:hypothetical protein